MRVAVYARVSTLDKDQNPEVQLREIREFCQARKWTVVQEFVDHGYSGATDNRPALNQMMGIARRRKIDAIVCWKMDRIGRSMKNMILLLEELNNLGVSFVSLTEGIDFSTAAGRFMTHILMSVASLEREILIERTKAGLRHAIASGKVLGRPKKHDETKIVELRATGKSYRTIAKELSCPLGVVSRAIRDATKSGVLSPSQKTG